jgi:hypothetical protein
MPHLIARSAYRSERSLTACWWPRAVSGWEADALISASLAALVKPFASAKAEIRHLLRSALRVATSFGEVVISHTTPRDRVRRAGAAGMAFVRGPAAAWHFGMS